MSGRVNRKRVVELIGRSCAEGAEADATAAIAFEPNHVKAHHRRAIALTQLGRHAEACEEYKVVEAAHPGHAGVAAEAAAARAANAAARAMKAADSISNKSKPTQSMTPNDKNNKNNKSGATTTTTTNDTAATPSPLSKALTSTRTRLKP